jgi:hypothetical protein
LAKEEGRDKSLLPQLSRRTVSESGASLVRINNQNFQAKALLFAGGPYQQESQCWLDHAGLLLAYQWDQPDVGRWRVERNPAVE